MLNSELYHLLNDIELGKYFEQEEINMFASYGKIIEFSSGEMILCQGKKSKGIYLILDGSVIVTAKMLGERTINLEVLERGSFFGEISFIENVPCSASVIANNQIKCLFFTDVYLKMLSLYFPQTKYKLFHAISGQVCHRLRKMHDKIVGLISSSHMTERSLFGEIIHSLAKPIKITFAESKMNIDMLHQSPFFCFFKKDEIDELFKHAFLVKASKNCTLIHKDEKNASCYLVIQGAVQSSIVQDKKFAKLSVIGPITLFASIACIDKNSPFAITFTTCEQTVLLKLSEETLTLFQKNYPMLWYKIFDLICKSLVALEKSIDKLDIRLNVETYNR